MPMAGGGGGGGQAAAIEAGRATVRLGADQAGLKSDLDKARRMVLGWGKNIAAMGGGLLGAGGGLLGGIGAAFSAAVNKFDAVKKAADRLGTSVEIISELGYAAEISGSNMEELEAAAGKLQQNIAGNADAFKEFGLDADKFRGKDLAEQMGMIAEAAGQLDAEGKKDLIRSLLGKSGDRLLPMFKDGAKGIAAMREEARKVGSSINGTDSANAERSGDAIGRVWTSVKNTFLAVGAALLPQVERLEMMAAAIVDLIGYARTFINDNRELVLGVTIGAAAVATAGAALIGLGGSLAIASFAVGGITTAWAAMTAVVAASVSPFALVVAGLAAASAVFALLFLDIKKLEDLGGSVVNAFAPILDTVKDTFGGIADAMKKNDLKLSFEIMVAGLEVVWEEFMMGMRKSWKELAAGGNAQPTESPSHFLESGWNATKYLFNEGLFAFGEAVDDIFSTPDAKTLADRQKMAFKRGHEYHSKEIALTETAIAVTNAKQAKLNALKAALAAKIDLAKPEIGPMPRELELGPMPREIKDKIIAAVSELGTSRVGFGSSNASARFGVGNVQEKQLRELEGIHREVKKKGGGIPVE